ncbi:hypothetical protein GCM10023170_035150 [Phytohabitans houttuyneae]|uniref:Aminoglycoside phosphotransferase domain-containing protein n=1 Tax=Phytohabitans houttuyneae TaxID=1076126 RepID=A0A6V8K5A3_9ACTN|nr:hypothetical protein Phou_001550 [Phytohabitans houttuyneae]
MEFLPRPWPGPLGALFSDGTLRAIEALIDEERGQPLPHAVLAHGDFDPTHIFCAGGGYSGLIDFGEIRGAEPAFDLGHFLLYDEASLLPALLRGYGRVEPLPDGHGRSIIRSAVLLGLRQLCRCLGPPRHRPLDAPGVLARARRLTALVGQSSAEPGGRMPSHGS